MPGGNWKRRAENRPAATRTENPFLVFLAGSVVAIAVL
eukprot:COSAG03_NODE_8191_length_828_cov_0.772291_1_plen_37_part_10